MGRVKVDMEAGYDPRRNPPWRPGLCANSAMGAGVPRVLGPLWVAMMNASVLAHASGTDVTSAEWKAYEKAMDAWRDAGGRQYV